MRALFAAAVCLLLALPGAAEAKGKGGKKSDAKKAEKKKYDSAYDVYKQISGAPQPLPKPTDLSLHFEIDEADAELYAVEVSAAADATDTTQGLAFTVADWRKQMGLDIRWLTYYRKLIAAELRTAQRDDFAVAVRYLGGLFDSADQFLRLAKQEREQFEIDFPRDRDGEKMTATPAASRRIRLYRDRAQVLFTNAKAFLERTVKGRDEQVVRLP